MAVEDAILETIRALPPERQCQVLDPAAKLPRRSAGGLWVNLCTHITGADIDTVRREMWGEFPRDFSIGTHQGVDLFIQPLEFVVDPDRFAEIDVVVRTADDLGGQRLVVGGRLHDGCANAGCFCQRVEGIQGGRGAVDGLAWLHRQEYINGRFGTGRGAAAFWHRVARRGHDPSHQRNRPLRVPPSRHPVYRCHCFPLSLGILGLRQTFAGC